MRGLVKVTGMPLQPNSCVCCGSNPHKEDGSGPEEAIFAEGVDIDWGNSVYICKSCVNIMATLFDYITPEEKHKLEQKIKKFKEERDNYKEDRDVLQSRIDRMLDGKAAIKEAKGAK